MKERDHDELERTIAGLTHVLSDWLCESKAQFSWMVSHHHFATKHDLEKQTQIIMSAISDFANAQKAFNDRQDKAIADIQDDIQNLSDQIAQLQSTQGQITPEDQALLDGIQARASALSDKLDALDALTPPKAPTGGENPPANPPTDPTARRNA
jgi:hypothetical protein